MPRVHDRDHGYKRLKSTLRELDDAHVYVGVLQDRGSERTSDGKITLAGYAAVNEFGSEDGRVPERSFLRSTVDEERDTYEQALQRGLGKVIDGTSTTERELGLVGARVSRDVKRKIRELKEPANAPLTIERKGSANPLIDTGRLRQSITFLVKMDGPLEEAG